MDKGMLVLRRGCGQSVVIGLKGEIVVKVLREENGIISLGIRAPKSITVDREEVYLKRLIYSSALNEQFSNKS